MLSTTLSQLSPQEHNALLHLRLLTIYNFLFTCTSQTIPYIRIHSVPIRLLPRSATPQTSINQMLLIQHQILPDHSVIPRANRAAEGGERACKSRIAHVDSEIHVVTKNALPAGNKPCIASLASSYPYSSSPPGDQDTPLPFPTPHKFWPR